MSTRRSKRARRGPPTQGPASDARRREIRVFHGDVLPDNTPMLRLLRSSGYPLSVALSEDTLYRVRRLDAA